MDPEVAGGLEALPAPVVTAPGIEVAALHSSHQHGNSSGTAMFLNPFCPFSTARILALRATVLLLLTLLIKAKLQIKAASALGLFLLLLQTLVFLAISGGLGLLAGGAVFYAIQQRRPVDG
jgi:hypothetical protein